MSSRVRLPVNRWFSGLLSVKRVFLDVVLLTFALNVSCESNPETSTHLNGSSARDAGENRAVTRTPNMPASVSEVGGDLGIANSHDLDAGGGVDQGVGESGAQDLPNDGFVAVADLAGGDVGLSGFQDAQSPDVGRSALDGAVILPDSGEADDVLNEILFTLRENPDNGFVRIANSDGFPVPLGNGQAFVATRTNLTHVAGDHDDWQGQELNPDLGFSWGVLPWRFGARYKFTNGVEWRHDEWSRAYGYDEFGPMSLMAPQGAHLERWFALDGVDIAPRTIRVWVPEGEILATAYMHDGQNLFDPMAIWGGWRLTDLMIEGLMVVGIDNSPRRMWEYTPVPDVLDGMNVGGGGNAYGDYLRQVIRPLIRQAYGEGRKIGILGSSLGGLISLHLASQNEGEFDFAASLSGTVGWGKIGGRSPTLIDLWQLSPPLGVALYLDSGGPAVQCVDADGDGINDDNPNNRDNFCQNQQLLSVLLEQGWALDQNIWYAHEVDAPHNEAAWAQRIERPLRLLLDLALEP